MSRRAVPVVCAVVQALSIVPGQAPDAAPLVALLASLAGAVGGVALTRRDSAPLGVLGVVLGAHLAQTALRGAVLPIAMAVAVAGAARSVVTVDGRLCPRSAIAAAGGLVAVAVAAVAVGRADVVPTYIALLLLAAMAGVLRAVAAFRIAGERRSATEQERLRLARDLHDVVGHGMSAIAVQAGAGRLSLTAGDATGALRALSGVEQASRAVLRETRWLVSLLRDDVARHRLADVAELVDGARRAGMTVVLETSGDPQTVPDDVGEAAYRVVQEALTNVVRHAGAAPATVRVDVGEQVQVGVLDQGQSAALASEGNGLRGLRERVAAVGGSVQAGPLPTGGWAVRATLPVSR